MLKLAIAVLAVALAGTASAGGWRSLRVDGSSEAAFGESVAALQEKLTPARRYTFERALQDILIHGTKGAEGEQRETTTSEYWRQLDGLGYEEVVTFTDPTGETARRYRAAYNPHLNGDRRSGAAVGTLPAASWRRDVSPPIVGGEQMRGATAGDMGPARNWN